LGCTHYPLLKPLLHDVLGPSVRLIDSAEETAAETARTLSSADLCADPSAEPSYRFIASDDPLQFLQLGQRCVGGTMEGVEIRSSGGACQLPGREIVFGEAEKCRRVEPRPGVRVDCSLGQPLQRSDV